MVLFYCTINLHHLMERERTPTRWDLIQSSCSCSQCTGRRCPLPTWGMGVQTLCFRCYGKHNREVCQSRNEMYIGLRMWSGLSNRMIILRRLCSDSGSLFIFEIKIKWRLNFLKMPSAIEISCVFLRVLMWIVKWSVCFLMYFGIFTPVVHFFWNGIHAISL